MKLHIKGKFIIMFVALMICLSAAIGIFSFVLTKNRVHEQTEEQCKNMISLIEQVVPADRVGSFFAGENSDEYSDTYDRLREIKEAYKPQYLYLFVPLESGEQMHMLFDIVAQGDNPDEHDEFGAIVPDGSGLHTQLLDYFNGGITVNSIVTNTEEYGYVMSSYGLLKDSSGNNVAVIGVDMGMDMIISEIKTQTFSMLLITVVIIVLFCALCLIIVNTQIVKPIKNLSLHMAQFDKNKTDFEMNSVSVRTNDEIELMANSYNNMAQEIHQYIDNLRIVTAERERIATELDVATHIQKSMLPCIFPAFPDRKEIDIYATMDPAKEVGGDFYDFFMVDDRHLAIVMADVSGKGVPAALFMVIGKTLIKDHTQPGVNLGTVFSEVNNLLCESNSEGLFITAFEGVLDLVTGEFTFVNAGHETPYICKKGEGYEPYKIRPGFVLAGMEGTKYRAGSITLNVGDKLFQYTDGVTEATDASNTLYGNDRLKAVLDANRTKASQELLSAVKADIDKFVGDAPQFDDITMLCLEYRERMEKDERTDD